MTSTAVQRVDHKLADLAVGDPVGIGVLRRMDERESANRCALQRDEDPHTGILGFVERGFPRLGELVCFQAVKHLGWQHVGVILAPRGDLDLGDRRGVAGPGKSCTDIGIHERTKFSTSWESAPFESRIAALSEVFRRCGQVSHAWTARPGTAAMSTGQPP